MIKCQCYTSSGPVNYRHPYNIKVKQMPSTIVCEPIKAPMSIIKTGFF